MRRISRFRSWTEYRLAIVFRLAGPWFIGYRELYLVRAGTVSSNSGSQKMGANFMSMAAWAMRDELNGICTTKATQGQPKVPDREQDDEINAVTIMTDGDKNWYHFGHHLCIAHKNGL